RNKHRVIGGNVIHASGGQRQNFWKQRRTQCLGGRSRHSCWQVAHAIVNNLINPVGRVVVTSQFRGFTATTLIDGDIDKYSAWIHRLDMIAADNFGSFVSGHKHSTYE